MIVELNRGKKGEGTLGTEYTGYLAIVKDPSRVELGLCKGMGKREGQRMLPELAEYNRSYFGASTHQALLTTVRRQRAVHHMVM